VGKDGAVGARRRRVGHTDREGESRREGVPRIVGNALLRRETDGALDHVHPRDVVDREEAPADAGDVGQPGEHGEYPFQVVFHQGVGDAVGEHDHLPSQLVVGGVDGLAHQLVQGLEARKDDGGVGALLDGALTEADQVGANAHGAPDHELREGGREGGREGKREGDVHGQMVRLTTLLRLLSRI
jgi:hypothetical protein